MQEGHPLCFFSRKFDPAQSTYTVTQKELLPIAELFLKRFCNNAFGHEIIVYTDHYNLTYNNS